MSHRFFPIVLHKSEWERLKRQGSRIIPEGAPVDSKEEYFNTLNEQSRKWISHWPDSAEGVKEKLEMQRKKQHKEDIALIDAFIKSRKHENTQEAVKLAKQLIFNDSCYGRQLTGAIIESRTIEEREAQIAFKEEIKQREGEFEKNQKYADSPIVSDLDDKERDADRKLAALECVKFNREIELMKKVEAAKLKAEKIQCECVDDDMIKQFQEAKAKKKADIKLLEKQEIEEYAAITKEIKKNRKIHEDCDNALIEVYKKDQDRIKCKVNAVLKKIIEEKRHGERAVTFYKMIDEMQKAENKKYVNFVKKGIKKYEERTAIQEANDNEIENKKRAERCKTSQENKISAETHTAPDVHKCVTLKHYSKTLKKIDDRVVKAHSQKGVADDLAKSLKSRNKLVEALKKREKESSGYTGVEGADKYFAEQASEAIQGTKHKYFARKVVDEYLKVNGLNQSALVISNY